MQGGVLSEALLLPTSEYAPRQVNRYSISGGLQSTSEAYPDSYKDLWVQFTRQITGTAGILIKTRSVVVVDFAKKCVVKEIRYSVELLVVLNRDEHFLTVPIQNDLKNVVLNELILAL